jgi:hypothetical protein
MTSDGSTYHGRYNRPARLHDLGIPIDGRDANDENDAEAGEQTKQRGKTGCCRLPRGAHRIQIGHGVSRLDRAGNAETSVQADF